MRYEVPRMFSIFCIVLSDSVRSTNVFNGTAEDSTMFEGDIVPDYITVSSAYGKQKADELVEKGIIPEPDRLTTRGTTPTFDLWQQEQNNMDYFVIPVYIDPEYADYAYKLIKKALQKLMRKTGVIKFRFIAKKPKNGRSFIHISTYGKTMCGSYVGRKDRAASENGQEIWIGYNCLNEGTIQHEMLHAMGFWHEQSRPDRDSYITINYDNISENHIYNFEKQSSIDSMGAPYDYDSVMHYSTKHFTSNGKETITPKTRSNNIGQRKGISAGDRLQVRLMYQCSSGPRNYAAYQANKCTMDCKCGENMRGCKGKGDSVCKGKLQCEGNVCIAP